MFDIVSNLSQIQCWMTEVNDNILIKFCRNYRLSLCRRMECNVEFSSLKNTVKTDLVEPTIIIPFANVKKK